MNRSLQISGIVNLDSPLYIGSRLFNLTGNQLRIGVAPVLLNILPGASIIFVNSNQLLKVRTCSHSTNICLIGFHKLRSITVLHFQAVYECTTVPCSHRARRCCLQHDVQMFLALQFQHFPDVNRSLLIGCIPGIIRIRRNRFFVLHISDELSHSAVCFQILHRSVVFGKSLSFWKLSDIKPHHRGSAHQMFLSASRTRHIFKFSSRINL